MNPKNILVVDDETSILNLFKTAFENAGYQVKTATNGNDALEILDKEDIQVMFLDLNMPEMDGIELCRKIKKKLPISIVYAMTGYATLFELTDCLDAGFSDYFKKPINMKTLFKSAEDGFDKISRWKKR